MTDGISTTHKKTKSKIAPYVIYGISLLFDEKFLSSEEDVLECTTAAASYSNVEVHYCTFYDIFLLKYYNSLQVTQEGSRKNLHTKIIHSLIHNNKSIAYPLIKITTPFLDFRTK